MLAVSCEYTFIQNSFIGREYLLLKLQALEVSTHKILESLKKNSLKYFFSQIRQYADEIDAKSRQRRLKS